MSLQWIKVPHRTDGSVYTDILGVGRYMVARETKGSRQFVLTINGKPSGVFNDKATAIADIEEVEAAKAAKAVRISGPLVTADNIKWKPHQYGSGATAALFRGVTLVVANCMERLPEGEPTYNISIFGNRLTTRSATLEEGKMRALRAARSLLIIMMRKISPNDLVADLRPDKPVPD